MLLLLFITIIIIIANNIIIITAVTPANTTDKLSSYFKLFLSILDLHP